MRKILITILIGLLTLAPQLALADRLLLSQMPLSETGGTSDVRGDAGALTDTRASTSTVVLESGLLSTAAIDTPAIGQYGLYRDGATRTNLIVYSNDFTQANWVKSNCDTVYTQAGPTGAANTATLLTATDADATALITLVAGAADHIFSVWLKRVTGTGSVYLTDNDGTNWTEKTITSTWTRYSLAYRNQANPIAGIKIATSGDAVAVAYAQITATQFLCADILTEGAAASRAADTCTYTLPQSWKNCLSVDQGWATSLEDETGVTSYANSFYDGQSWFAPNIDISAYAASGTRADNAVIVRDAEGDLAWGFLGEVGAGESLGVELFPQPLFDSAGQYNTVDACWTSITGGVATSDGGSGFIQKNSIFTAKKCYKSVLEILTRTSGSCAKPYDGLAGSLSYSNSVGISSRYVIAIAASNLYIHSSSFLGTIGGATSIKEVTEPAATAVHVYKDAALTTEGWNMESTFNMSGATTFDIIPASQCSAEGTLVCDITFGANPDGVIADAAGLVTVQNSRYSLLSWYPATPDQLLIYDGSTSASKVLAGYLSNTAYTIVVKFGYVVSGIPKMNIGIKGAPWVWGSDYSFDGYFALYSVVQIGMINPYPFWIKNIRFYREALSRSYIESHF